MDTITEEIMFATPFQDHLNWGARYTLDLHNEDAFKNAYGYLFEMA